MSTGTILYDAELCLCKGAVLQRYHLVTDETLWADARKLSVERGERIHLYVHGECIGSVFAPETQS